MSDPKKPLTAEELNEWESYHSTETELDQAMRRLFTMARNALPRPAAPTFETSWGWVRCHDGSFVSFPVHIPENRDRFVGKKTRVTIRGLAAPRYAVPKNVTVTEWMKVSVRFDGHKTIKKFIAKYAPLRRIDDGGP